MTDPKPKSFQQILVPIDTWDLAGRIAGAERAQGKDSTSGKVAAKAIQEYFDRLPADTKEFIEQSKPAPEAP